MRNIFLLAKFYAYKSDSNVIDIWHIKNALNSINITNDKAREIIYEYLQIKESFTKHSLDKDYTIDAQKVGKIIFSKDVKRLKKILEDSGFYMSSNISNLILGKHNKSDNVNIFKKIRILKNRLKSKIYGQERAIEAICDKLSEATYLSNDSSPLFIMFFLGPPATGKTYLPEVLADNMAEYEFRIFDMSVYSSINQGFSLFGSSKGYQNACEGRLTGFVKRNPKSIIVFDEIEKSHPAVIQNFLYLLSKGKVRDEFTQEIVDFSETILIFTSNIGSEIYSNRIFLDNLKNKIEDAESMILETISREEKISDGYKVKVFSPEFLSRISQGDVVLFDKMSFDTYLKILSDTLKTNFTLFKNNFGIEIESDSFDILCVTLLFRFIPNLDVRQIKSKSSRIILDNVTDLLRDINIDLVKKIKISQSKAIIEKINDFLKKSDIEKDIFLKECLRKNNTFTLEIDRKFVKNEILIRIKNLKKIKLKKSKDFLRQGGIILEIPSVAFSDIVGHERAKENIKQIINLLKNPKKFEEFNIDMPKGMLLYGPPGTGKTMLAKAFANEANLPFISTNGTEIIDIDFMREIFNRAREYAPCVIFIDEIDAIGARDGGNIDIVINQLLVEIDGFRNNDDVFIIAATNFVDKVDGAILRSGRIDQYIHVDFLEKSARKYFVDKILDSIKHKDIDREKITKYTSSMSGADIEKVRRESILYMIKNNIKELTEDILIEQINIVKYGQRSKENLLKDILISSAYHEAGHAVISAFLTPENSIEQVTITPRKNALGFISYEFEESKQKTTKKQIKNKLCVMLAGRASQMRKFSDDGLESGASDDLAKATHLAYIAISRYGMGESIGYISLENISELQYSFFVKEINDELRKWMQEAEEKTDALVKKYWDKIEKVAKALMEKESLSEKELYEIIKLNKYQEKADE